jgi:DNA-binding SARP family transcriptional activator
MVADGTPCAIVESSRRLLVYLALSNGQQPRSVVAASLWPEKMERRACANLRASLWRLPEPNGVPLVVSSGSSMWLSEEVDVDVWAAEALGWALTHDPKSVIDHVDPTLFLLELLPGWYDDWVVAERERIAQLQLHFLETLTYALIDQNRLTIALDTALRLVNIDPYREGSQRALLAVYMAERSHMQARRQFESYRRLVKETFQCEPSATLRAMLTEDR